MEKKWRDATAPRFVDVAKNYKEACFERRQFQFIFFPREGWNPAKVKSYVFPIYGAGLWDASGVSAIGSD